MSSLRPHPRATSHAPFVGVFSLSTLTSEENATLTSEHGGLPLLLWDPNDRTSNYERESSAMSIAVGGGARRCFRTNSTNTGSFSEASTPAQLQSRAKNDAGAPPRQISMGLADGPRQGDPRCWVGVDQREAVQWICTTMIYRVKRRLFKLGRSIVSASCDVSEDDDRMSPLHAVVQPLRVLAVTEAWSACGPALTLQAPV